MKKKRRASSSRSRKRLIDGGEQVGVGEVQIPGRRRDVGVSHQTLDDVDVHAAPDEARGVGVPPAVREVPPREACATPGMIDEAVHRTRAVPTGDRAVGQAVGIYEQVGRWSK